MRTHRTVYRVLNADGTEAYRGKRSAVLRFLNAKRRQVSFRDKAAFLNRVGQQVQHGRYDPLMDQGPTTWEDDGPAESFRTRSNP